MKSIELSVREYSQKSMSSKLNSPQRVKSQNLSILMTIEQQWKLRDKMLTSGIGRSKTESQAFSLPKKKSRTSAKKMSTLTQVKNLTKQMNSCQLKRESKDSNQTPKVEIVKGVPPPKRLHIPSKMWQPLQPSTPLSPLQENPTEYSEKRLKNYF